MCVCLSVHMCVRAQELLLRHEGKSVDIVPNMKHYTLDVILRYVPAVMRVTVKPLGRPYCSVKKNISVFNNTY